MLQQHGYFKGKNHRLIYFWEIFSTQFPKQENPDFNSILRQLVYCRLVIVSEWPITNKSDQQNRIRNLRSTYLLISNNIENILLKDPNQLKDNVEGLRNLIFGGYYTDRKIEHIDVLYMLGNHCISLHNDLNMPHIIPSESFNLLLTLLKSAPEDITGGIKALFDKILKISVRLFPPDITYTEVRSNVGFWQRESSRD